jgi:hypothetical protein
MFGQQHQNVKGDQCYHKYVPWFDSCSLTLKLFGIFSLLEFHLSEEYIILEKLMSNLHKNEGHNKDKKYYQSLIYVVDDKLLVILQDH